MYKKRDGQFWFFLVHPGGPFWRNKDLGAWSIPKGELAPGEDALQRAKQEFLEETSRAISGALKPLAPIKQKAGKTVYAWAVEGDIDCEQLSSNTLTIEWPPRSGRMQEIPEVDQWAWFRADEAKQKINTAQIPLLEEVEQNEG